MSNTIEKAAPTVLVAEVVRTGEAVTLPENMSITQAIKLLQARAEYEAQEVVVTQTIRAFPHDGAVALHRVLTRKYGWAQAVPTPGFFGPKPPQMMTVKTGVSTTIQVPWGRFELPNIKGWISTSTTHENGMMVFQLVSTVKRESEKTVEALFREVRDEAEQNSIYRGKAIKIRFRDNDGDPISLPEPEFLDTESIDDTQLVYSDPIMAAVETNLFTPILRAQDCIKNKIPLKRGVLLAGTYGTGKTMAAYVASKYAEMMGITYLYVPRADELSDAIAFAKHYQSPACVVFCEDIDRVASGDRSVKIDDILNIIDGIDTKKSNIIVVLTTNDLDSINPAMLRPGRLDAVINVTPPDAKAVEKLLRIYGRGVVADNTDLSRAGELLSGQIPAIIAEVVKRAKLSELKFTAEGGKVKMLSEQALTDAAAAMRGQINLLDKLINGEPPPPVDPIEVAIGNVVRRTLDGRLEAIDSTHKKVKELHANFLS